VENNLVTNMKKWTLIRRENRVISTTEEKSEKVLNHGPQEILSNKINKEPIKTSDFGGLPMRDIKKNLGCG